MQDLREYLQNRYEIFTLGSKRGRQNSPMAVHGAYDVIATTLTDNQKRAIGDFTLFVATRALDFLIYEIKTLIDAKFEDLSTPAPKTLYHSAHTTLYGVFREQFLSISQKYFRGFISVHFDPDAIDGPRALYQNLNELSIHVLDLKYNTETPGGVRLTLLQDFVSLIRLVESSFRLHFTIESQNILQFITFLSSELNLRMFC